MRHIIKPVRDDDFYVNWSDNTDCPVEWGSREEMLNGKAENISPERLDRADEYGSSSFIGADRWDDDDELFVYNVAPEMRVLKRADLRAFCEGYDKSTDRFDLSLTEIFDEDIHG